MEVQLILVPYDSAHRGRRMGAGPEALLAAGLSGALEAAGHRAWIEAVEAPGGSWLAEIATAFALMRGVAAAVRQALAARRFPLVLAGNCNVATGVVAGLGGETGVLWFDAHGDFNTPDTTVGGFLDGMALAILTGRCWPQLARAVEGYAPVPEERVVLLGARDLDPLEAAALRASPVMLVGADAVRPELMPHLASRLAGVAKVYLHLDLDVLDPEEGRANQFAAPGGVRRDPLLAAARDIGRMMPVAAATISAYDPSFDEGRRVAALAIEAIRALVGAVGQARQEGGEPGP